MSARHTNLESAEAFFGGKHKFPAFNNVYRIARVGVLVDVLPVGDVTKELEYENVRTPVTSTKQCEKFRWQTWHGVRRAIGFPNDQAGQVLWLRVSPIGVVAGREKLVSIRDMTFENTDGDKAWSVSVTIYWDHIPACALAGVMHENLRRVLGLRVKFGHRARILNTTMDAKNAFRKILVYPDGAAAFAAAFGYVLTRYLVVDVRMQFGWQGSPRWRGVISAAMEHA